MSFKRGYDSKRTWEEWLLQRSRHLAFIAALLVLLVFLLIFGPAKPG